MDTKAFEVLVHSQYAFDVCRNQVNEYEDCRQTDSPLPKNPMNCRNVARSVVSCYREAEKMHPICVAPFNDSRECLFKADGNLLNCRDYIDQYVYCQKDQEAYRTFLEVVWKIYDYFKNSTAKQKQPVMFDFFRYRGHFDKHAG